MYLTDLNLCGNILMNFVYMTLALSMTMISFCSLVKNLLFC